LVTLSVLVVDVGIRGCIDVFVGDALGASR